jgi:hypothetical protein
VRFHQVYEADRGKILSAVRAEDVLHSHWPNNICAISNR